MAYASWSVVFGEQPSAAKWNILGTNDSSFNDGTGIGNGVVGNAQLATGVLVQQANTISSAVATGTTTIPNDDTIPQNTEGDQYMSLAITPKASTNILYIEVVAFVSHSAAVGIVGTICQDSTANALSANGVRNTVGTEYNNLIVKHTMAAGTTSSTTFKFRSGGDSAGTLTFNGSGATRRFGGIGSMSSLTILEFKV